jgi:hypothetical protein
VTTDPGLGPIEREHASTLRSMTAAEPIPDEEIAGAAVYCEPKPLHAASEHKTLELETVKLAKDIDPRKLPTELKLRRPVLHVLPASDPNWPAPAPQPDGGWPSHYDSGWPPPETVVTRSQPPLPVRRSFIPLVLLVLLGATVLLVFGARARHRASLAAIARRAEPAATIAAGASPPAVESLPGAPPAPTSVATSQASASAPSAETPESSAESAAALASAQAADPAPNAAPARFNDAPHHAFKPASPANANGPALNAPATAKPKRAIY